MGEEMGKRFEVTISRYSPWPLIAVLVATLVIFVVGAATLVYPQKIPGVGILLMGGELKQIVSPVHGVVESWLVEEGDSINNGDEVALVRAADDDSLVKVNANSSGVVAEIISYAPAQIRKGQALAIVTSHGDVTRDLELVGFVSSLDGKLIQPGMKALISPSIIDVHRDGNLLGTVKRVGKLPMTKEAVLSVVKIPEIAKYIRSKIEAEPFVVVISLDYNTTNMTGYRWNGPGPTTLLDSGIFANFDVIYQETSMLSRLWSSPTRGAR